jgi:hypothetical protein
MCTIQTHHGKTIDAPNGSWVVYEYYKGFVNDVWVYTSYDAARRHKESLSRDIHYTSPKHFSIRQIKD